MSRFLVIGGSHAKSLAQASAASADSYADVRTFFATDRAFAGYALGEDGVWRPKEMKRKRSRRVREKTARANAGAESIDAASAERVLFVGAPNMAAAVARLLDGHDVDGLRRRDARGALSAAAFDMMLEEMAEASRLPADRRALTGPEVSAMLAPFPSEAFRNSPARAFAPMRRVAERPEGFEEAMARFAGLVREAYAADGIRLVPQPPMTLAGPAATLAEFAEGGPDAATERERDYTQMTAAFGRLCLDAWLGDAIAAPDHADLTAQAPSDAA